MKEYSALWWKPEDENKKFHGILKFEENNIKLILEDYDSKEIKFDKEKYDILLGKSIDGEDITLINCYKLGFKGSLIGGITKKIFVEKTIIGKHFSRKDLLKFNEVNIHFDLLDEWIGLSGFDLKNSTLFGNEQKILYKVPEDKKISINNNTDLIISFNIEGPTISSFVKEIEIIQKIYLKIKTRDEISLDEIYDLKEVLKSFLCLGTQKSILEDELNGIVKISVPNTDLKISKEIRIIDFNVAKEKRTNDILPFFLFDFSDFGESYETFFKKWF